MIKFDDRDHKLLNFKRVLDTFFIGPLDHWAIVKYSSPFQIATQGNFTKSGYYS